jgi:hypothetical protein
MNTYYKPLYGEQRRLLEIPLAGISSVSLSAKSHKQSIVSMFYDDSLNDPSIMLVRKEAFQDDKANTERIVLEAVRRSRLCNLLIRSLCATDLIITQYIHL